VEYRLQKLAVLTKAYITMPVTSADVESSFSKFASVLFPLHQSLVSWQFESILFCVVQSDSLSGFRWLNWSNWRYIKVLDLNFIQLLSALSERFCSSWVETRENRITYIYLINIHHQFISHSDFGFTHQFYHSFKRKKWYYLHLANSNFTQCQPSVTEQQPALWWEVVSHGIRTIFHSELWNFVN